MLNIDIDFSIFSFTRMNRCSKKLVNIEILHRRNIPELIADRSSHPILYLTIISKQTFQQLHRARARTQSNHGAYDKGKTSGKELH